MKPFRKRTKLERARLKRLAKLGPPTVKKIAIGRKPLSPAGEYALGFAIVIVMALVVGLLFRR